MPFPVDGSQIQISGEPKSSNRLEPELFPPAQSQPASDARELFVISVFFSFLSPARSFPPLLSSSLSLSPSPSPSSSSSSAQMRGGRRTELSWIYSVGVG